MDFIKKIRTRIRSEPAGEERQNYMFMSLPDFLKVQCEGYVALDRHPDIKACIKKIADLVSSIPIHQMQNTDKGNIRLSDGLSRKIDIDPSPYLTRKTLIYKCVEEMLLRGNSFLLPAYDRKGYLQELKPVDSRTVGLNALEDGGYTANICGEEFESDEIVNFVNNPCYDMPWKGQSYRIYVKDLLKNLNESNNIKSDFYTKHFRPGLIFLFQGDSDAFQSEDEREKVFDKWLRTKPGTPYMVPEGLVDVRTFNNMSLSDIAINESVELDKRFIAALVGVPAFFVGIGNFNEKEYNNFIDTTIRPIVEILQQELTKKLIIASDRFLKFNIDSLKAFDMDYRLSALYRGKAMGVFNGDEIRVAAGYEPTGLKEMQEFTILENYINVKDTGKQKKLIQGGEEDGTKDS